MSALLREATAAWWGLFAPLVLQGTLILLLLATLDGLLLRRAWPELRAALWSVALLRLVLPFSLLDASALLRDLAPRLPSPFSARGIAAGDASAIVLGAELAFVGWTAGVFSALLLMLRAYRRAIRTAERASTRAWPAAVSRALEDCARSCALVRVPALIGGPLVRTPFTAGLLRPRIYLPLDAADRMNAEELRHVLLHELMHVKRRDAWRALAAGLVGAIYWFHPLAWFALHRLEHLREQCCDRDVARVLGGEAPRYRRTLLALAARHAGIGPTSSAGTPGFLGRSAGIVARLRVLEHEASARARLRRTLTALSCGLLLSVLVPISPASSEALARVGDALERPPGCLLLRMEVLRRLAEENAASNEK